MSRKNNRKKGYRNINFAAAVTCFAVIIVIVLVLFVGSGNTGEPSDVSSQDGESSIDVGVSSGEELSEAAETSVWEESSVPEMTFEVLTLENTAMRTGDLVIASPEHPLLSDSAEQVVSVWENKTSRYKLADLSVRISSRILPALNRMADVLYDNTGSNGLTLSVGYRTIKEQQTAHDSSKNTNGREPSGGCSDLNTGLSFNAWVYPSTEGNIREGKFAWLSENCYEYGFIRRYPDGKSNLTGIDASSDYYITYRYVGMPHSYLIFINDYCLEEYLEFVMRFSVNNRYSFEKNGVEYEIYYVPVSENGETTDIPVPLDYDYTVSGDNIGGFVVTIVK